ncbi:MAG: squalene/phytoene synthase family protein [Gammaproteobacteria bacterium]|nr:squalene/phytoene synthase family protein [Gammaproteobacteria bacterium]
MNSLDETYGRRAAPPGSARYFSWLFAGTPARAPLLGTFALLAEWRAAMHGGSDPVVAAAKIEWWREEMRRLALARPVHPICRYLAALPGAAAVDWRPLEDAAAAAAACVAGAPVERDADLSDFADDLIGKPLRTAARLAAPVTDTVELRACTRALASAEYIVRAIEDQPRAAQFGRILFPVRELLDHGIGNDDLCAAAPGAALGAYLERARAQAARHFAQAALALPAPQRPANRGLLVLAALGAHHLRAGRPPGAPGVAVRDLFLAWRTARRASRTH